MAEHAPARFHPKLPGRTQLDRKTASDLGSSRVGDVAAGGPQQPKRRQGGGHDGASLRRRRSQRGRSAHSQINGPSFSERAPRGARRYGFGPYDGVAGSIDALMASSSASPTNGFA